jgi:hypothetical protein
VDFANAERVWSCNVLRSEKIIQYLEGIFAGTLGTRIINDSITGKRTTAILKLTDSLAGVADAFSKGAESPTRILI